MIRRKKVSTGISIDLTPLTELFDHLGRENEIDKKVLSIFSCLMCKCLIGKKVTVGHMSEAIETYYACTNCKVAYPRDFFSEVFEENHTNKNSPH